MFAAIRVAFFHHIVIKKIYLQIESLLPASRNISIRKQNAFYLQAEKHNHG